MANPELAPLYQRVTKLTPPISELEVAEIHHQLAPLALARERAIAQAAELYLIDQDATAIEALLQKKGLRRPKGYGIFTAGFQPPEDTLFLSKLGEPPFESFPAPEAVGHEGGAYAVRINEQNDIILILTGRAHPTEWVGERFASMIVAHPLRVMKEMIRRQRADDGTNPPVFLTYLAGVIDGYPMQPGDAGIVISDMELSNVLQPGFGPVGLLDQYLGSHFQPKLARSSDPELARQFVELARLRDVRIFPASVCGAPGTPEFETGEETVLFQHAFKGARRGETGQLARRIFGRHDGRKLTPLFDMGITFELATMRQMHTDERDIPVLAMVLATDSVGEGSLTVSHAGNFQKAMAEAPKYRDLLLELAAAATVQQAAKEQVDRKDFSLRHLLFQTDHLMT